MQKPKMSRITDQLWDVAQALYDNNDEMEALHDEWMEDGDDKHEEPALTRTAKMIKQLLEVRGTLCDSRDPLILEGEVLPILAAACASLESGLRQAVESRAQIDAMTPEEREEKYVEHPVEFLWSSWGRAVEDDCEDLSLALLVLENNLLKRQIASPETSQAWGGIPAEHELTDTEQNILTALGNDTIKGRDLLEKAGYNNSSHYRQILSNLVKRHILGRSTQGYYNPRKAQDRSSRL